MNPITRDQLQDILAHDNPTDIWVLNADLTITAIPDQDLTALQDPATWPKYLCRSESIDNIVLGIGWEPAIQMVNHIVTETILGKPGPKTLATNAYNAIRTALTKETT